MIKKTDSSLLNWIYKHVVDFTLEDDESGLSWESTNKEALSFMHQIPKKEKVQKYGVYAAQSYCLQWMNSMMLKRVWRKECCLKRHAR